MQFDLSGVRLSRRHLSRMDQRGWGRVIFISSESARHIPTESVHYDDQGRPAGDRRRIDVGRAWATNARPASAGLGNDRSLAERRRRRGASGFVSLTGGCGCGAVRFEIDRPLVAAAYCHCTRCQHRSGTATQASARIEPGSMRIVRGEEELRGWFAGDGLEKVFCGSCGSALLARDHESGEIAIVRLGAIEGDPGIRPSARQFVAYAAP